MENINKKYFSVELTEEELRLFSEFQKEFGARERKMRRKADRAAQNAEMHANRAMNKSKKAVEAIKRGEVEVAEALQASAQKAINSTAYDIKRLTDQSKNLTNQSAVAEKVNNVANNTQKAQKVVNNARRKVATGKFVNNNKALLIGGGIAAGAGLIGTGIALSRKRKNNEV